MSALAMALVASVLAAPGDRHPVISEAEEAYDRLDFERAARLFQRAIDAGRLERAQLSRAWGGLALSWAVLGRRDAAEEAFKRALAADPDWKLPENVGPKVRSPFADARAYWQSRAPPSVTVSAEGAVAKRPVNVSVEVADPLGMVELVRVEWKVGPDSGDVSSEAVPRATVTIGGASVQPPELSLTAVALDGRGSVVAVSKTLVVPVAAPPPEVERVAGLPKPPQKPPQTRPALVATLPPSSGGSVHAYGGGFGSVLVAGIGAEVGASYGLTPHVDVGALAALGAGWAVAATLAFHPSRTGRLSPYFQLRGLVAPVVTGLAPGAGLMVGGTAELGPGRAVAGVAAEGYAVQEPYAPFAVLLSLGYELDLPL